MDTGFGGSGFGGGFGGGGAGGGGGFGGGGGGQDMETMQKQMMENPEMMSKMQVTRTKGGSCTGAYFVSRFHLYNPPFPS